MAHYLATRPFDAIERLGTGIAGWTAQMRKSFTRHRTYRQSLYELSGLTERDLADLGLHRSTLKNVAWEAACRKVGD